MLKSGGRQYLVQEMIDELWSIDVKAIRGEVCEILRIKLSMTAASAL